MGEGSTGLVAVVVGQAVLSPQLRSDQDQRTRLAELSAKACQATQLCLHVTPRSL